MKTEIHINAKNIDYLIVSEGVEGVYDYVNNTVSDYIFLDSQKIEGEKVSWFKKVFFGAKDKKERNFPRGYYKDGYYTQPYILLEDVPNSFYDSLGRLHTKPFIVVVSNDKRLGTVSFETVDEMRFYLKKRYGRIAFKRYIYDIQRD